MEAEAAEAAKGGEGGGAAGKADRRGGEGGQAAAEKPGGGTKEKSCTTASDAWDNLRTKE